MSMRARRTLSVAGGLLAFAAAPAAASAQQALAPVNVTVAPSARAESLVAKAQALPTTVDQFSKSARLYELAAASRAPGDAQAAAELRRAAFFRYYAGESRASVSLMERAAEHAAALGDVVGAANAYIDAALMAVDARLADRAKDLGRRAELLAESPMLDSTQRSALRGRMAGWHDVDVARR